MPVSRIREELSRLMRVGRPFADFTFSVFEVDSALTEGRIFEFHDIFRECADKESQGRQN